MRRIFFFVPIDITKTIFFSSILQKLREKKTTTEDKVVEKSAADVVETDYSEIE